MSGRNRALSFLVFVSMGLFLALVFYAGAYFRDLQDSSDPQRVVRDFFIKVKAGDRDGALSFWNVPDDRRKSFGDIDLEITESFLRERKRIRSVEIRKLEYLDDPEVLRPTDKSRANVAEVSGYYVTDKGKKEFQISLRNVASDVPFLKRLGPIWKVYLAATGE